MTTIIINESENAIENFKNHLINLKEDVKIYKTNKKVEYYNVASCFDIEASSFYENFVVKPENKRGLMYAWVFGIYDVLIMGRTWKQFLEIIDIVKEELDLFENRRIIVYVQNLGYDFQFFRKHFYFKKVFALDTRDPIQAITDDGIEFRCSYKLSGYSLAKMGEHLLKHNVRKRVGDLDYSKIRTPETPLTKKEWGYVEGDGEVLIAYIEEEIETAGNITKIPLTKTGKIRNYCRDRCLHSRKSHKKYDPQFTLYRRLMKRITINSVLEYEHLHASFMGGYTHGNHKHVGEICYNVSSFDFTSSYPAVMIAEQYPIFKSEMIILKDKKEFEKNINLYNCIFTATFYNIEETFTYDHYISVSKCYECINPVKDNGRIVKADKITIFLTEQDYFIIRKTYKWEKMTVKNFRRYRRGYLPREFVLSILDLYEKKTTLKGIDEMIAEYQQSKENLNGCYGMTVTDICRDNIIYNSHEEDYEGEEWGKESPDYEKVIEKYNNDKRRFLFYAWGVWVTAYARRNLWEAIIELGEDYRYSDTDSVKFVNLDAHRDFFTNYNKKIARRIKRVLEYQKIDFNKAIPKTKEGKIKLLGEWDYEGTYDRFKYLGAKRYMTEENGELSLTVSGLNKKTTIPYLKKVYKTNDKIFEEFKQGLMIPKGYTGKQIHTYIDDEKEGIVRDYLGNEYHYKELSAVHMEDAEYLLDINADFLKYLLGVKSDLI